MLVLTRWKFSGDLDPADDLGWVPRLIAARFLIDMTAFKDNGRDTLHAVSTFLAAHFRTGVIAVKMKTRTRLNTFRHQMSNVIRMA